MSTKKNLTLGLILFFTASFTHAEDVQLAIGLSLPPYVIEETQSGIEFEMVKEALLYKNHHLKPRFVILWEAPNAYKKGFVDGVMTVTESFGLAAYFSDVVIAYQNYAITLAKKNIQIHTIEDLKGKNIIAFQNAKIYLGDRFAKTVRNAIYKETSKQLVQVNLLYSDRIDVVVADKNIFLYYRNQADIVDTSQKTVFHPIFPPNPYKVGFRDVRIRDDFNKGLQHLRQTGRYDEIIKKYIRAESP